MKKFELYLGIAMIIAVTALICIYMIAMEYTNERFMFVTFFSLIGYIVGYLFIDSYITRTEVHNYIKGHDDCKDELRNGPLKDVYKQWTQQSRNQ